MNIKTKIGAATLAAVISIGGGSAAFAAGNAGNGGENGTTNQRPKVTAICAHKDQIVAKLTERQTKLTARIEKLTALATKATDAGHADRAAKINERITRLHTELDRVTKRLAAAPAFIAAHCV